MELDYGLPTTYTGASFAYPDFVYNNQGAVVVAEQVNTFGSNTNLIQLEGNVTPQITGVYIDGSNKNYPGVF